MLYDLTYAEGDRKLLAQLAGGKHPIPKRIANKPRLLPGLDLFMGAFWDLITCRTAPGLMIPWTATNSWADAETLDRETRLMLHGYIRQMDLAFLKWVQEKQAKAAKNKDPGNGKD